MNKRWLVLALAAATSLLVYAMPALALPVLFTEIAADLELTLVQIGVVWGAASLAGFLTSIPYGFVGDRLGPRRTIVLACVFIGLLGALRGLAFNYLTFVGTVLLHSLVMPALPPNLHKTAGLWFPEQRGLAAGMVSAGFALGLALGSGLSATVLSPWLGNWQRVLFFYGALALVVALLWLIFYPEGVAENSIKPGGALNYSGLRTVTRSRELWLIGLGTLCFWACYKGFVGYLPIYLKALGWSPALADQTLTLFYSISLIGVVPLSVLSDRLRIKRELMFIAVAVVASSVLMLSLTQGILLWVSLALGGFFFDAFMAIHQAATLEAEGIGSALAGTALGFIVTLREFGGFVSPPLGNALAASNPSAPFLLWAIFGFVGVIFLYLVPRRRKSMATI